MILNEFITQETGVRLPNDHPVSILPHAEFGRNHQLVDAHPFYDQGMI